MDVVEARLSAPPPERTDSLSDRCPRLDFGIFSFFTFGFGKAASRVAGALAALLAGVGGKEAGSGVHPDSLPEA